MSPAKILFLKPPVAKTYSHMVVVKKNAARQKKKAPSEYLVASVVTYQDARTEMELYSLWHPRYGYIYDLVRDAPEVKEDIPRTVDSDEPLGYSQPLLFAF
jgi:hypothetical protein